MHLSIIIILSILALSCAAFPQFQHAIPNGNASRRVESGILCGGLGHERCSGSDTRNAFGVAFMNAGFKWTAALCAADSDGDGLTNGQELGDPCCKWKEGDGEQGLRLTQLSHPGRAEEINHAEPSDCS